MTGVLIVLAIVVVGVLLGLWAWRSSARQVPSDETLRHPHPDAAEPLIRGESRHFDTPAAADVDVKGGREHRD